MNREKDSMRMRLSATLLSLALVAACGPEPLTVTLADMDDRTARFDVANASDDDLESVSFELVFRSADGGVTRADTVSYESVTDPSTCDIVPFVRSGEQTFFAWRVPPGSVSVTASVVETSFFDGKIQPGTGGGRWCAED